MEHVYRLLLSETKISKRGLFYTSKDIFSSQRESDRAISRAAKLLNVERFELNIYASSRSFFAGGLRLFFSDCTDSSSDTTLFSPTSIRGDIESIFLRAETTACCVFVIEKYSFFHRLISSELFRSKVKSSCVLVTACGYPNDATVFLLRRVGLPVLVLVDYDPYGLDILATYERRVPCVSWAGLTAADLHSLRVDPENIQCLSKNDVKKAVSLMKRCPKYRDELQVMIDVGKKIELEAVADDTLFETILIERVTKSGGFLE